MAAIRRLAAGRTVLLVTHRPALLAAADRVFHVEPPSVTPEDPADVPGVDVRQVPLLMSDPDATTALARAALDAAGV